MNHHFTINYKVPEKYLMSKRKIYITIQCHGIHTPNNITASIISYTFQHLYDVVNIEDLSSMFDDICKEAKDYFIVNYVHGK